MTRPAAVAILMVCGAIISSCASLPPPTGPKSRVSADYTATGDVGKLRAFVYSNRTVIDAKGAPQWISVRDENGVGVRFEREGNYLLLSGRLERFSVWLGTRVVSFDATAAPQLASDIASIASETPLVSSASTSAPVELTATKLVAVAPASGLASAPEDPDELLRVSAAQLEELRRAIADGTPLEQRELMAKLNRIDAQLTRAATAIVHVQFETARSEFDPQGDLAKALVPAAKAAERINVRGRTGSRIADAPNARIALARALAAREYLVEHGVDGGRIKVFALAAGDFVAPSSTSTGMALNRRVDIELVNRHAGGAPDGLSTGLGAAR